MSIKTLGLVLNDPDDSVTFGEAYNDKYSKEFELLRALDLSLGDDYFTINIDGEEYYADPDSNVREYLSNVSKFDIRGLCLNVAHKVKAVQAFKIREARPTVVAVVFNPDNEILLVSNSAYHRSSPVQGGMFDETFTFEGPIESLKRELAEEVSMTAGFSVYPTEICVSQWINLTKKAKVDILPSGEKVVWKNKQYHFYAVFFDGDLSDLNAGSAEVDTLGFYSFDHDIFDTVAEYKQDVVASILTNMPFYRGNAVRVA